MLHAIATFGEYIYGPDTQEAAATVLELANTFCEEYPINQDIVSRGDVGLLFGRSELMISIHLNLNQKCCIHRYPGDVYQGGNPWQLLTAVTAELFYKGGNLNAKKAMAEGRDIQLEPHEQAKWKELLYLPAEGITILELAQAQARLNIRKQMHCGACSN